MVYSTIGFFLRCYMRLFTPNVKISSLETLPANTPFILVCDTPEIMRTALYLAANIPASLRFILPIQKELGLFKSIFYKTLHIHPLLSLCKYPNPKAKLHSVWKAPRELITSNQTLVFFSNPHNDILPTTDKGAAKLAFHTASVFDFSLSLQIIPLKVNLSTEGQLQLDILPGIYISTYEKAYKQHPARTINEVTELLRSSLSHVSETKEALNPILTENLLS